MFAHRSLAGALGRNEDDSHETSAMRPIALACRVQVATVPKMVFQDAGHLSAAGHWVCVTDQKASMLPAANTVSLSCERGTGRCIETLALLYQRGDAGVRADELPNLILTSADYNVVEWSPQQIVAQNSGTGQEIRVVLATKEVERSARDTGPRAPSDDPNIIPPQHWVLK